MGDHGQQKLPARRRRDPTASRWEHVAADQTYRRAEGDLSQRTLLVGIGAQKAGTTWLGHYFNAHPAVFMSPIKELHHFSFPPGSPKRLEQVRRLTASLERQARKLADLTDPLEAAALRTRMAINLDMVAMALDGRRYLPFFTERAGDCPVMCEITPNYSALDLAGLEAIAAAHTRVKIFFIMRNPVDRMWSNARDAFGAEALARIRDKSYREGHGMWRRTDYARTLTLVDRVFRPEQVHLDFYETLFNDAAMERLTAFAGVPFHPPRYEARANVSVSARLDPRDRASLCHLAAPIYHAMAERFGEALPESWRRDMADHNL